MGQQGDSSRHKRGSEPAAMVHMLLQKHSCRQGVGNEGERCGRGADDTDISPRQRHQRLANANAINSSPNMNCGLAITRRITWERPCDFRTAPKSPISFIARDCNTSPEVAVMTMAAIPAHMAASVMHRSWRRLAREAALRDVPGVENPRVWSAHARPALAQVRLPRSQPPR